MTWDDLRERFVARLIHRHYHSNSVKSYRTWLERLADFAQSQSLLPADLTRETADAWGRQLETLGYTENSRMQALGMVRHCFRWAASESLVLANPFGHMVLPQVRRLERVCPTPEQMDALLSLPDQATVSGLRDHTMMALMYGVGVRVSECRWLDVDDVDSKNATLSVRQAKGGRARLLPLGKRLLAQLETWLRAGRPPLHKKPAQHALFLGRDGDRMGITRIEQIVHYYGQQAGLGRVTPHLLRHAFGSHLLNGGADARMVQVLLGHQSLQATQTYTHVTEEQLIDHLNRTHPRFAPKPEAPDILP